jgi:hypothetical protein
LVEQFSWDGYIKVIQSYYNQPSDSTPGAKYDTWAKKYSQAVNKNLCPYFSWFGWPLSTATKAACASLPTWEEDPFNSATPSKLKINSIIDLGSNFFCIFVQFVKICILLICRIHQVYCNHWQQPTWRNCQS